MKKFNHPNIVKLIDTIQTENHIYIVSELCEGGDLRNLIKNKSPLQEQEANKILADVVNGLKAISSKNIVHRDLKPANILIHKGITKIADFGFSRELNSIMNSVVGTPM
jgi:serine/threonine-protein kinase ULK/ATG1